MTSAGVAECIEDALSDLHRQGRLTRSDVEILIDLHGLPGTDIPAVFDALAERGVRLDEDHENRERDKRRSKTQSPYSRDTVGTMLSNAARVKLLTADEEVDLGRRIAIGQKLREESDGDESRPEILRQIADGKLAHSNLVLANLRLVVSIARRYRPVGMDLADLIQEGTLGLMRAADKFDHTMGFKFSTYATWWVRQSITRGLADKGRVIRLPVHVTEKLQKVTGARSRLRESLSREPSSPEIARELGEDLADVRAILDLEREPISLDMPLGDDTDTDLGAVLNLYAGDVAEEVIDALTNAQLREALDVVSKRHAEGARGATAHAVAMLRLRYGLDDDRERTLDEIGAEFGVTRERARQILNKIMASPLLREPLTRLTSTD